MPSVFGLNTREISTRRRGDAEPWRRKPGVWRPSASYSAPPRLRVEKWLLALVLLSPAFAQLPDGPGKAETQQICTQCHDLARSISLHQDRAGWQATIDKMVTMGAKASDQDLKLIGDYLAKNFPAEEVPKINVNTARSIDLEAGLTLRRSQAAAIIAYRDKNGPFHSIADLEKVPGIDAAKIESHKDRLTFDVQP